MTLDTEATKARDARWEARATRARSILSLRFRPRAEIVEELGKLGIRYAGAIPGLVTKLCSGKSLTATQFYNIG